MLQCFEYHHRECPYYPEHPLIKEKEYYDFREEYIQKITDRTWSNAEKDFDENTGDIIRVDGKLKQKIDPKKDPKFKERVKMCTVMTESSEMKSDGYPVIDIALKFCSINEQCCGMQMNDEEGNPIDQGECCNKD